MNCVDRPIVTVPSLISPARMTLGALIASVSVRIVPVFVTLPVVTDSVECVPFVPLAHDCSMIPAFVKLVAEVSVVPVPVP
jgi:hypothetical protein